MDLKMSPRERFLLEVHWLQSQAEQPTKVVLLMTLEKLANSFIAESEYLAWDEALDVLEGR
jgi:hypothetical protein